MNGLDEMRPLTQAAARARCLYGVGRGFWIGCPALPPW